MALEIEPHPMKAGLSALCEELSGKVDSGLPLAKVVSDTSSRYDKSLIALLVAGLRMGKLSESLELFADLNQRWQQVRRDVLLAAVYPFTVMLVAVVLFSMFVSQFLNGVFVKLGLDATSTIRQLVTWNHSFWWWPFLIPAAMAIVFVAWWFSGRHWKASAVHGLLTYTIPGLSSLIRSVYDFQLSRLMSLLVDRDLPLPETLELAAACTGRSDYQQGCLSLAAAIREGRELCVDAGSLPPLLKVCCYENATQENALKLRLNGVSAFYERRVLQQAGWLQSTLPVGMLVILGGGSVVLYSMSVFLPIVKLFESLAV